MQPYACFTPTDVTRVFLATDHTTGSDPSGTALASCSITHDSPQEEEKGPSLRRLELPREQEEAKMDTDCLCSVR